MNLTQAGNVAKQAAKGAGRILMDHFYKSKNFSYKSKSNLVTEVDLLAEAYIIESLQKNFPDHGLICEESGYTKTQSEYVWVIDPIDGTINYFHNTAPFRIAICLTYQTKPILTAVYNPLKSDLYFSQKGKGAFMNETPIKICSNEDLQSTIVLTHISIREQSRIKTLQVLEKIFAKGMHMRSFGSSIASLTYVARGTFEIFFHLRTHPWDILPGSLLVEEAGGIATDMEGRSLTINSDSVLATNGKNHEQLLSLFHDALQ